MRKHGLAFFFLLFSLILYFSNLSALPYFNKAYNLLGILVQPLFELRGFVVEKTKQSLNTYLFLKGVSEENQRLKSQLEECSIYRAQLLACESELINISKTIELTPEIKTYPLLYASIIAYDPSGKDTFLIINKGRSAGLKEGMLVFYGDNLVGIIDRVYGDSSRVRTVFAQEFSISALSKEKAYIYKGGHPYGFLLYVNLEDTLEVGDVVFLRVPGKSLPRLTIGTVHKVWEEGKGFFKKVEVKPAVDIRRISSCLIIKEVL